MGRGGTLDDGDAGGGGEGAARALLDAEGWAAAKTGVVALAINNIRRSINMWPSVTILCFHTSAGDLVQQTTITGIRRWCAVRG